MGACGTLCSVSRSDDRPFAPGDPSGPLEDPAALPDEALPAGSVPGALTRTEPSVSLSALFGTCSRTGAWSAPEHATVNAWFGEVKLDFRDADLPDDGVVEVDATAVCGQVTLIVERGTEVELDGTMAIFGEVSRKDGQRRGANLVRRLLGDPTEGDDWNGPDEAEPMLLRVTGLACFGAVTVELI